MKIAFISSEAVPYAKTGGLADVAGSLPKALEKLGCDVKLFIPKYSVIDEAKNDLHYNWSIGEIKIKINDELRSVHLHQGILPGSKVEVNLIDCPYYFFRTSIYTDDIDEDERFILFSKGVIEVLQRMKWAPDVIHCNDWQTGLLPLYIKDNYNWDKMFDNTATLFTIHNIGYQGRFSKKTLFSAEIKGDYFYPEGPVEYFDDVSLMKTGIMFSEIINTVSQTYALEILTPEYGAGMDPILRTRRDDVYGILNGIDYTVWNPEHDKLIPFRYSLDYLTGKSKNKEFLLDHLNLPNDKKTPLIAIVSRMVAQKGFDIFVDAIDDIMELDAQWVILGNGQPEYEKLFQILTQTFPEKITSYIGFNNELSHLIEAGADIFLMPSHYEPCGLNQMFSLRYGTVPVVRETGGLADTVLDWDKLKAKGKETGTGFTFAGYNGKELFDALQRAVKTFHNKTVWKKIQANGMQNDYSWEHSAKEYLLLYKKAINKKRSTINPTNISTLIKQLPGNSEPKTP
jgi:starch synthase